MKKCDEQAINVDEQARQGENEGEIHHGGHGGHGVDCKLIQKLTNFNLLPNLTFYSVLSVSSVVK